MMPVQVAKNTVKEKLTPDPNSIIDLFQTSQNYKSGTVSVWVNGLKKIASYDDGFVEVSPNQIRLTEPPLIGDSVQAEYEPL